VRHPPSVRSRCFKLQRGIGTAASSRLLLLGGQPRISFDAARGRGRKTSLPGDGRGVGLTGFHVQPRFEQIEANRRNARKSTGPITEEGEQRSRRNAVRHGLTAETVISALEDAEDYKAFEAPPLRTAVLKQQWSVNWCCD
jgi:hypothetical protein